MSDQFRVRRYAQKRRIAERGRERYLKRRLRDPHGIYRVKRSELYVVYKHYYDFWGSPKEYEGPFAVDHTGWLKF